MLKFFFFERQGNSFESSSEKNGIFFDFRRKPLEKKILLLYNG